MLLLLNKHSFIQTVIHSLIFGLISSELACLCLRNKVRCWGLQNMPRCKGFVSSLVVLCVSRTMPTTSRWLRPSLTSWPPSRGCSPTLPPPPKGVTAGCSCVWSWWLEVSRRFFVIMCLAKINNPAIVYIFKDLYLAYQQNSCQQPSCLRWLLTSVRTPVQLRANSD